MITVWHSTFFQDEICQLRNKTFYHTSACSTDKIWPKVKTWISPVYSSWLKATRRRLNILVVCEELKAVGHVTYLWCSDIRQVGWSRISNYCRITIDRFSRGNPGSAPPFLLWNHNHHFQTQRCIYQLIILPCVHLLTLKQDMFVSWSNIFSFVHVSPWLGACASVIL